MKVFTLFKPKTVESVCFNRLCKGTATMAFTGRSRNLHIIVGMVWDMMDNLRNILQETSKTNAYWDMGRKSQLTMLSLSALV